MFWAHLYVKQPEMFSSKKLPQATPWEGSILVIHKQCTLDQWRRYGHRLVRRPGHRLVRRSGHRLVRRSGGNLDTHHLSENIVWDLCVAVFRFDVTVQVMFRLVCPLAEEAVLRTVWWMRARVSSQLPELWMNTIIFLLIGIIHGKITLSNKMKNIVRCHLDV